MARKNKNKRPPAPGTVDTETVTVGDERAARSSGSAGTNGRPNIWHRLGAGERIAAMGILLLLTFGAAGAVLKYLEESAKHEQAQNTGKSNFEKTEPSLLSKVNPFAAPPTPAPTPQLSKEYIYAGSRMLAVEDANANAAPPADLAVWRPSTGYWYVLGGTGSQQTFFQWGSGGNGDQPAPGDYDGDGKTDFSVFRPSDHTWYVVRSSDGTSFGATFGQASDQLAPADYDGDGRTDVAVFRAGTWYIERSSDAGFVAQQFGLASDTPTPADFDGDGRADCAVWRSSTATFYILKSATNSIQAIQFGATGDKPVVGDYDGDGKADATVWKAAPLYQWQTLRSSNGTTYGTTLGDPASDIAVQNDYDADGKTDMAIWRPSEGKWYIQQSSNGQPRTVLWGQNGDIPVPAFYRR